MITCKTEAYINFGKLFISQIHRVKKIIFRTLLDVFQPEGIKRICPLGMTVPNVCLTIHCCKYRDLTRLEMKATLNKNNVDDSKPQNLEKTTE